MLVGKLDRVAVVVRDVNQAMKDLNDLLGCEFYGPIDDVEVGVAVALPRRGGVELMSPTRGDDLVGATRLLDEVGERITGVAFRVPDIEAAEQHMAARGLKPAMKIERGGMKEILYPAQEGTHGLEIALNEYPEANGLGIEVSRFFGVAPQ
jgi:methylmalonyl-CoA/ethylmalonyl-CoA epimerase